MYAKVKKSKNLLKNYKTYKLCTC